MLSPFARSREKPIFRDRDSEARQRCGTRAGESLASRKRRGGGSVDFAGGQPQAREARPSRRKGEPWRGRPCGSCVAKAARGRAAARAVVLRVGVGRKIGPASSRREEPHERKRDETSPSGFRVKQHSNGFANPMDGTRDGEWHLRPGSEVKEGGGAADFTTSGSSKRGHPGLGKR